MVTKERQAGGDRLLLLVQQIGDVEDPGPDAIRTVGTVAARSSRRVTFSLQLRAGAMETATPAPSR